MEENSLVELPVEHMQHVGQALPELTFEFLSAHTTQTSEMYLKEKILLNKQAELRKLQEKLLSTDKNVSQSVRTIFLREDTLAKLGQECADLERDVAKLVQKKLKLEEMMQKMKEEEEMNGTLRIEYQTKMESYQFKMKEMEKLSPIHLKLEELREKIFTLKSKRASYFSGNGVEQVLSGNKQKCILDEIATINASNVTVRQENIHLEEKIGANCNHMELLKKDGETEQKKQAAQVRRLHRLLNDAQARRRRWIQEEERLINNIMQVRQRIED